MPSSGSKGEMYVESGEKTPALYQTVDILQPTAIATAAA